MSRYDWMGDASCAQTDPDLWHTVHGGSYTVAERICLACPVRPECETHTARLDAEGDVYGRHGMWAAQTRRQRRAGSGRRKTFSREDIVRLIERGGMTAYEIADHVGCDPRTVWRVQKAYREEQSEAVSV